MGHRARAAALAAQRTATSEPRARSGLARMHGGNSIRTAHSWGAGRLDGMRSSSWNVTRRGRRQRCPQQW